MNIKAVRTGIFKEGEDLLSFITKYIPKLKDGSVLVVTSKIVALSEGRTARIQDSKKIIRAESDWVLQTKHVALTEKDGMILANAGVDESNANGKLILLPEDSFKTAQTLRSNILQNVAIKKLGVIISDSRVMPLRAGVVGIALGYAGFRGVRDYRGKYDVFGRKLKFTQTDIADSLATAATLVMGEGDERQPLAVIEDAPVVFSGRVDKKELLIPMKDDMYYPLFKRRRG